MDSLQALPFRQKIILGLTFSVGIFILLCSNATIISVDTLNTTIIFYSISVPTFLLGFSTIIDLNEPKIFLIWYLFSIVLLVISFQTYSSDKFLIHRTLKFEQSVGINSLIVDYSTSSLKALFAFLTVYWFLNILLKWWTGNFIVNTFRQYTWFNSSANRQMTWRDVLFNFILMFVIILAALFGK